jgi:hypothetical protein
LLKEFSRVNLNSFQVLKKIFDLTNRFRNPLKARLAKGGKFGMTTPISPEKEELNA